MSINEPDPPSATEVHPDLFFTDAFRFGSDYLTKFTGLFDGPDLGRVLSAFVFNIESIRSFAFVPQTVMSGATAHYFLITEAALAVLGRPVLDDSDLDRLPEVKQKADEILLSGRKLDDGRKEIFKTYSHSLLMYNKRQTIPILYDGFRHILAFQIAGAYSAFEIFAKDLWIAALDKAPRIACEKFFEKKVLEIGEFHRYGFDFRANMGQVLAKTKKVTFDSLDNLREAYEGAFPKAVFPSVFSDPKMKALSEVRNVIAHNAGVSDPEFAEAMGGNTDWDTPIGRFIPVNGRKARDMTDTVTDAAVKIAKGVSQHMKLHSA